MHALLLASLLAAAPPSSADASKVDVLFAGDVTLGYHYEEWVDEQVQKGGDKDALLGWGFENVKALTTRADLFVVNLECPFTLAGERIPKNFNFRARPELVASLLAGGVDVVSLANNHLMDFGAQGLADTRTTLDTVRIAHFGAGQSLAEARAPRVVEAKGVRFAFLGYFFLGDRNIEPVVAIAAGERPGVAGIHANAAACVDGGAVEGSRCDLDDAVSAMAALVEADVRAAKTRADHVIPFFHWGREGSGTPEPYQVQLAHAAVDAGASAVIGSHPHVLQGIEVYRGAPIVYSLGNFVFGGNWNPRDKRTALVQLTFTKGGLADSKVIPAISDSYPERPCQPYLATGERAEDVRSHLIDLSSTFDRTLPDLQLLKIKRPTPARKKTPGRAR